MESGQVGSPTLENRQKYETLVYSTSQEIRGEISNQRKNFKGFTKQRKLPSKKGLFA